MTGFSGFASKKYVIPNGKRTFTAAADNCEYSFTTENQNSVKVLLVSKAIFKLWSLDRSSSGSIKSDDRW